MRWRASPLRGGITKLARHRKTPMVVLNSSRGVAINDPRAAKPMRGSAKMISPEQCIPEHCLPLPESYPRLDVWHIHTIAEGAGGIYVSEFGRYGQHGIRDARHDSLANRCVRLHLTAQDGAGHLFGATWEAGKWSPELVAFDVCDTWVDLPTDSQTRSPKP